MLFHYTSITISYVEPFHVQIFSLINVHYFNMFFFHVSLMLLQAFFFPEKFFGQTICRLERLWFNVHMFYWC
jgi:hypothetical protein